MHAGPIFTFSSGIIQWLVVSETETVKEILQNTSLNGKPSFLSKENKPLLGHGIVASNYGLPWAHQRKIIAPELYTDKVKVSVQYHTIYAQENKYVGLF